MPRPNAISTPFAPRPARVAVQVLPVVATAPGILAGGLLGLLLVLAGLLGLIL